jgi:hypothetical protein
LKALPEHFQPNRSDIPFVPGTSAMSPPRMPQVVNEALGTDSVPALSGYPLDHPSVMIALSTL